MGQKKMGAGEAMRGLKKAAQNYGKTPVHNKNQKAMPRAQNIITKDARSFLNQRMGKKVKDLRHGSVVQQKDNAQCDDDDDDGMTDAVGCAAVPLSAEGLPSSMGVGLAAFAGDALKRGGIFEDEGGFEEEGEAENYENTQREAEINRRKFYVELRKVLAEADIIIEVLDARDPESCRCEAIEREIVHSGKKLVLLMNKIDLVPSEAVEAWTKHLQRSHACIAFKAAHGAARTVTHAMCAAERAPAGLLRSTHAVVGADELMQLLKNYSRMTGTKSKGHVTVGIVGYPNTGKSSVINSMKRQHAVATGGRAGVTTQMQAVQLDSKVTLLDCPGVVFEGDSDDPSVVLRNVVSVESVGDPVYVVDALLQKAPRAAVLSFYGLSVDFANVMDFLVIVAQARGKLKRGPSTRNHSGGGGLDIEAAARSVISDWTTGKFRYYVMPPIASSAAAMANIEAEQATIVTQIAPQFDIDALFAGGGDAQVQPQVLGRAEAGGDDDDMNDDEPEFAPVAVDAEAMAFNRTAKKG